MKKRVTNIHLSKEAAIENLKRFFANTSEDAITIDQALTAWERDLAKVDLNKGWLSNKMVDLKYHNLVASLYAVRNNRRVLSKLQLTFEGKRALGRITGTNTSPIESPISNSSEEISGIGSRMENLFRQIAKFRADNPEFEIEFNVKLKGA